MDKPATPLPCPFCGGEARPYKHFFHVVECLRCNAEGPSINNDWDGAISPDVMEAEAITAWNRRVPHLTAINAELVEALRRLEYWFNTDEEILDAMDHNTRADHELLQDIRTALARAKENSNGH